MFHIVINIKRNDSFLNRIQDSHPRQKENPHCFYFWTIVYLSSSSTCNFTPSPPTLPAEEEEGGPSIAINARRSFISGTRRKQTTTPSPLPQFEERKHRVPVKRCCEVGRCVPRWWRALAPGWIHLIGFNVVRKKSGDYMSREHAANNGAGILGIRSRRLSLIFSISLGGE